jgi:threonine synthase
VVANVSGDAVSSHLVCASCGTSYALAEKVLLCTKCGGLLDVTYELDGLHGEPWRRAGHGLRNSLWRYGELLPVSDRGAIVSLGEGHTPLVAVERYGQSIGVKGLSLKLEFMNPTGSFKDRGTTVNVSKIRELGISSVLDDSSGNAGSSLAAYSAAAGIQCRLYVPTLVSREKLVQAEMYGATIVRVDGARSEVAKRAEEAWRSGDAFYASHALSPYFIEGTKTIAYEIAEEFGTRSAPDHMVFPVGGGSLLLGAWKGFSELKSLGRLEKIPKLHCIQSDACDPVVRAFKAGKPETSPVAEKETVAAGIRISNPARGRQVLSALRGSRGSAESVSDAEILDQQRNAARMAGAFAEPTSCAALAGLARLRANGVIGPGETVVVPLTGSGLKDIASATKSLAR